MTFSVVVILTWRAEDAQDEEQWRHTDSHHHQQQNSCSLMSVMWQDATVQAMLTRVYNMVSPHATHGLCDMGTPTPRTYKVKQDNVGTNTVQCHPFFKVGHCAKHIGITNFTFKGHVTSPITPPFDSPYRLETNLYLLCLSIYLHPDMYGARPLPSRITWRYRAHVTVWYPRCHFL